MAEYVIQGETLTGIADAIRAKSNKAGLIPTTSMAGEIMAIETGSTPDPVEQATPSIDVSSGGLITASATQGEGYVSAGTKSATKQLTVQAEQTITPGTSDKTIPSGRYLTGVQTIKGDPNLIAENIKSGVSIFGILGSAGLLSGISAVTVVTFVPPNDYSVNREITVMHNLGVVPDFYIAYTPEVSEGHASVIFELSGTVRGQSNINSFRAAFEGDSCVEFGYKSANLKSASTTTITISPATNSTWDTVTYYLIVGKTM